MKECVYCGKEFEVEGIYFCKNCIEEIKSGKTINTGNVIGNWIIGAFWYMEQNNGNYWKDEKEITESNKQYFFIRAIDYIRFAKYMNCIGANTLDFPMSATNMNEMERWYLSLADKYAKDKERGEEE